MSRADERGRRERRAAGAGDEPLTLMLLHVYECGDTSYCSIVRAAPPPLRNHHRTRTCITTTADRIDACFFLTSHDLDSLA